MLADIKNKLAKAAELANYCAAQVVKVFGPRLDADQLINVKTEFGL